MAGDDDALPSLDDWDDEDWGHFPVPPPPPPSSLGPVCELQHCRLEGGPMGAHFNRASFPSLPIIAVCSSVVLVAVLVASFLLWRHKSKVQNLLPCKNEQQGHHLGDVGAANGVTYEDVLINHHPTRIPQGHLTGNQTLMPLEILDVKLGDIGPNQLPTLHHPPCYPTRDLVSGKPFHPVYEEVAQVPNLEVSRAYGKDFVGSGGKLCVRSPTSEDEFCEEEFVGSGQCSASSSVRGSTGGDLSRDPVSSDEGTGEDCEFMIHDLPHMIHGPSDMNNARPVIRRDYHGHQHMVPTYPDAGHKLHSKPLMDKRHMSPSHVPYVPSMNTRGPPGVPIGAQWRPEPHNTRANLNFPTSASQENIYSTIDEDELSDYPTQPTLPSLRGGNSKCKGDPGSPVRGAGPPLSQREENGSSYGDMMPAFHSASFM